MLFRSVLLPVSKDVVNGLISFLDYMEDEQDFLELAKGGEVSQLCSKYAEEASNVQYGYETLASDLLELGKEMDVKLKKVTLDVEALLQKHKKKNKVAANRKILSACLVTAGLATGAILALGLLGPGGLLFAPALAPGAFSASVAGGGAFAVASSHFASQKVEEGVALKASAVSLHDAQQAAQQQLPNAINKFAGAMGHLAQFFSMLSDSVKRIEQTADRVEGKLREETLTKSYKALYNVLLRQMHNVRKSCEDYNKFVSYVNIRVNNLQLEEQQPVLSYIETWFQEQQAQVQTRDAGCVPRLLKLKDKGLQLVRGRLEGARA